MILETGQEATFYASFFNPDGEKVMLVSLPVVEIFLENKSVLKNKMKKSSKGYYITKKLNLPIGKYLIVYSAISVESENFRGEDLLEIIPIAKKENLKAEFKRINTSITSMRKIVKQESGLISRQISKVNLGVLLIQKMIAKLLPSKKIEELLRDEKP